VNRYEGLFILNTVGKEEGVTELIEKVRSEINAVGGKVETVQKMDKRPFARVADKKHSSGFYMNVIFEAAPAAIKPLRAKFALSADVFRVCFTTAPVPVPEKAEKK
jgi:ribosomal protein S6